MSGAGSAIEVIDEVPEGNNGPESTLPPGRMEPTENNPRGYPPFDLAHIASYTRSQLAYYTMHQQIPTKLLPQLNKAMADRKTFRDALGLPDDSDDSDHPEPDPEPAPGPRLSGPNPSTPTIQQPYRPVAPSMGNRGSTSRESSGVLTYDDDGEPDDQFPPFEQGRGNVKIMWKMPDLKLPSTAQDFDNWESKLALMFEANLNAFATARSRIAAAVGSFNPDLNTAYNGSKRAYPILALHWRKFMRWVRNTALRGDSSLLRLQRSCRSFDSKTTRTPEYSRPDIDAFVEKLGSLLIKTAT